jgi:hypothetical protein
MNAIKNNGHKGISWRRVAGRVATGTAAAALALTTMGGVAAQAATAPTALPSASVSSETTTAKKWYFTSTLLGRNEVPEPGKKVNDRDGIAVAKLRIVGHKVFFLVAWKHTGRPTAFHIHRGVAGKNGPVVIDLLSNGKIRGNTAFGHVVVKDKALLKALIKHPRKFYANLHTKQFADGAVRGQLKFGSRW